MELDDNTKLYKAVSENLWIFFEKPREDFSFSKKLVSSERIQI